MMIQTVAIMLLLIFCPIADVFSSVSYKEAIGEISTRNISGVNSSDTLPSEETSESSVSSDSSEYEELSETSDSKKSMEPMYADWYWYFYRGEWHRMPFTFG